LRDDRKADLERHVEEVDAMLRPPTTETDTLDGADSGEEWSGVSDAEPPPVDHEAEYVDEEKYTTVTVEAMDVSKEGLFKAQQEPETDTAEAEPQSTATSDDAASEKKKRPWTKDKPKESMQKRKKKRNFRYEGKVERKEARFKQKARNSKQARERRAG